MANISFHLDDCDEKLIKNYAKSKNMSVSSLLLTAVVEKIEDEMDSKLYEQAMAESKNDDPKDITLSEVKQAMDQYYQ
ncbi:hypothetical protein COSHB9_22120 [Companilactobacillus alimentarius]|uniref:CopG family transcriptional regulator n=1 Tax=Companilactobacillus alimentarius DSM 20249 TaxID=1423720 RepID=A0A2K9HN86_9LACO|nr:DUF6290 family protein [Companilactobacillus alimentarius]AUI71623.1 hypothetical protein LA20249_05255 [Companilactobacillus alimentarius DSM 20249]KRK78370.1 hypothetical protein FC67_GL000939 [Companilactobacillus alimentarius DSM 20249]MDT6953392.1 DUF6290 family protein [Companilactobacillus alimentarius]GEO44644.1 hypothetical protein LAL01_08760 [Companilactobacillus alimentarius]